ncbi:hypothetical protein D3C81_2003490 [compost metagenome]
MNGAVATVSVKLDRGSAMATVSVKMGQANPDTPDVWRTRHSYPIREVGSVAGEEL